jgi:purine catabolism regulator
VGWHDDGGAGFGPAAVLEGVAMLPTVADVLALDPVRRSGPRVVAGRQGLTRPVRWVHVSEVSDIAHLLRGGELILTTGIALPGDGTGLTGYVGELTEVGAAGLMVELGRRYPRELPPALVRAADARGLPLVTLRHETRFVNITEAVHAVIVDAQLTELRASEEIHQIFTELSVEGAEPAEVIRQIARMSGRPVVLENLAHQVLAYDAAGGDDEELLGGWEGRSREVRPASRTGYDPASGWLVTVVGARGHDWGRLVLACPPPSPGAPAGPPSSRDVVLLERGASTLALGRLVARDRESLERQTHRTLLAGILTHAYPAAEVALRSGALGVPLDGRRLIGLVLRPAGAARHPAQSPALELQGRLRDLSERAAAAVRTARLSALVGLVDDASVGVLLALGPQDQEDAALDALAAALHRAASDGSEAERVVIAVGSSVDSVRDARRSLVEAGQVADAALHQNGAAAYYRLPDVRLRGLVHLLRDDPRLQTYVERELGPLLAHDTQHGTDLIRMLGIYLAHGRNKSAAADAAHLSRPSFYERLHRIERVLGTDLDSVESCLSLHVALLALDAIRR